MWKVIAEGPDLESLVTRYPDLVLTKGQRVKAEMRLVGYGPVPASLIARAFDSAGAEQLFRSEVPDGMDMVDVYEEGGKGIVEMEADPAPLIAVMGFIAANWARIALTVLAVSVVLAAVVVGVRLLLWVAGSSAGAAGFLVLLGLGAGALILIGLNGRKAAEPRQP